MDQRLFEIIACPVCHGKLSYAKQQQELICKKDRLAYPIVADIPVLLEEQARHLTLDEYPS